MPQQLKDVDEGKAFDWGRTSKDYAKYRDIYPDEFYRAIVDAGLGIKGQNCLDVGTGTGVIPRNMYRYGATWTGCDISENQILMARELSEAAGMDITYYPVATEDLDFAPKSFDLITAAQCFMYFKRDVALPRIASLLKDDGIFLVLYMAWLPNRCDITRRSLESVKKANPSWNGGQTYECPLQFNDYTYSIFDMAFHKELYVDVPFTRESWNGRVKACRGIGASLGAAEIAAWEKEHMAMLENIMPPETTIPHFVQMAGLRVKK